MLLLRKAPTGETTSSLLLLDADSDRCCGPLDNGVVTVTVWCWGARRLLVAIFGVRGCLFSALAAPALREGVWGCLEPGRDLLFEDIAASGGLFRGSVDRVGRAFLSRARRGCRAVATIEDGDSDGLLVESELLAGAWPSLDAVAGADDVVLDVVDFAERGPVVVATKTVPAEGWLRNPTTAFGFVPELLDTLD